MNHKYGLRKLPKSDTNLITTFKLQITKLPNTTVGEDIPALVINEGLQIWPTIYNLETWSLINRSFSYSAPVLYISSRNNPFARIQQV